MAQWQTLIFPVWGAADNSHELASATRHVREVVGSCPEGPQKLGDKAVRGVGGRWLQTTVIYSAE